MPSEPPNSTSRRPDQRDLTVLQVIKLSSDHLQKHGSDSARLDAEVLLAKALEVRRLDLYLQFDRELTEPELSAYRALVARRAHGEPVAYLVGHKEFMALDFEVTPAVLVPNPDTEVLVQRAVALAREAARPFRVADVGTGSGCIAVAVAHYAPAAEVWATDISAEALEVAARNVAKHGLDSRVHLACGDLMEPLEGAFDLVCANLPYLPSTSTLAPEVLAQPRTALYAGQGGAELVTRLLATAPPRLKPGGRVLAELDPSVLAAVLEAADRGFSGRHIHHDLGGHERVLEAWS
jgi:release factor glutamine methyltransferase